MPLSDKDVLDAAWGIVRRENADVRGTHPRAYRWALGYIAWSEQQRGIRHRRVAHREEIGKLRMQDRL